MENVLHDKLTKWFQLGRSFDRIVTVFAMIASKRKFYKFQLGRSFDRIVTLFPLESVFHAPGRFNWAGLSTG